MPEDTGGSSRSGGPLFQERHPPAEGGARCFLTALGRAAENSSWPARSRRRCLREVSGPREKRAPKSRALPRSAKSVTGRTTDRAVRVGKIALARAFEHKTQKGAAPRPQKKQRPHGSPREPLVPFSGKALIATGSLACDVLAFAARRFAPVVATSRAFAKNSQHILFITNVKLKIMFCQKMSIKIV